MLVPSLDSGNYLASFPVSTPVSLIPSLRSRNYLASFPDSAPETTKPHSQTRSRASFPDSAPETTKPHSQTPLQKLLSLIPRLRSRNYLASFPDSAPLSVSPLVLTTGDSSLSRKINSIKNTVSTKYHLRV